MTAALRDLARPAALVAAAAAAVLSTAWAWRETRSAVARIGRGQADLGALREIEASVARSAPARAAFEALAGRPLVPVEELGRAASAGVRPPEVTAQAARELGGGWRLRTVEVVWGSVPLERLGVFLAECEQARPPWRVAGLRVTAAGEPGQGRVAVRLEGLEREGDR